MASETWSSFMGAAHAFILARGVHDVYVYGSVARRIRESHGSEAVGDDIDFIVEVSEHTYQVWLADVAGRMLHDVDCRLSDQTLRLRAALELLDIKAGTQHYTWIELLNSEIPIDVRIVPVGWQDRIFQIQDEMPNRNPSFVATATIDAIRIPRELPFCEWRKEIIGQSPRGYRQALGRAALEGFTTE